jgi:hypothetical protein
MPANPPTPASPAVSPRPTLDELTALRFAADSAKNAEDAALLDSLYRKIERTTPHSPRIARRKER